MSCYNTRGIFTLRSSFSRERDNDWVANECIWNNDEPFYDLGFPKIGYYGGGYSSYPTSMEKLVFSTETGSVVPSGSLTIGRYGEATGNGTHGYFSGGSSTLVDKLSYSTETTSATPGATLADATGFVAATGTIDYGYFGTGGPLLSTAVKSGMYKLTFSTDTTASIPAAYYGATMVTAVGNPSAGYFGGGFPGPKATIQKLTYSSDTLSQLTSQLNGYTSGASAAGNGDGGYFVGGTPGRPGYITTKLNYSVDTTELTYNAYIPNNISKAEMGASGDLTKGYFTSGYAPSPFYGYIQYSLVEKLDYSTDTMTSTTTTMLPRFGIGAASSRDNGMPAPAVPLTPTPAYFLENTNTTTPDVGYFAGGFDNNIPAYYSDMSKIDFSTDTSSTLPSSSLLNPPSNTTRGVSNSYFGYWYSAGTFMTKLNYQTDSVAKAPGTSFPTSLYSAMSVGNSDAGYFGGGYLSVYNPAYSTVNKLVYSTDTGSFVGNLAQYRTGWAAAGNSTQGFFGGGYSSALTSTYGYFNLDKIVYSTDTLSSVFGAEGKVGGHSATGTSTEGYFSGGWASTPLYSPTTSSHKLTYSTTTRTLLPSTNMNQARSNAGSSGNSSYGYHAGGVPTTSPATRSSSTEKLSFSTETFSLTPGGGLSVEKYALGGTGPRTNGLTESPIPWTNYIPTIV
jgi:hypothetical protein